MANVVLKFDADEIRRAADAFNQCKREMLELQKELKNSLQNLRDHDWQGKAADKLFEILGEDWSYTVDRYCDLMEVLTGIMNDASQTYDQLLDEAKRLRLDA